MAECLDGDFRYDRHVGHEHLNMNLGECESVQAVKSQQMEMGRYFLWKDIQAYHGWIWIHSFMKLCLQLHASSWSKTS